MCVLAALGAGACGGGAASSHGGLTGAAAPKLAVEQFMAAARAQDLQAFSAIWGTDHGAARDVVDRSQLEKRELTMMCYLSHDKFDVESEVSPKPTEHDFQLSLTRGTITKETKMIVVQGPSERWYVQDVQLEPLQDLCSQVQRH
jgi:hypothetical protein